MDITTFIIATFCLIDDQLADKRLRRRGPQPTLRDSEVSTIQVVGEFLGLETSSDIFAYFRRQYEEWFPGLGKQSDNVHSSGSQPVESQTRALASFGPTDTA